MPGKALPFYRFFLNSCKRFLFLETAVFFFHVRQWNSQRREKKTWALCVCLFKGLFSTFLLSVLFFKQSHCLFLHLYWLSIVLFPFFFSFSFVWVVAKLSFSLHCTAATHVCRGKKTVITSLFNKLTPFFPFCCLRKKSPGCSRAFLMEGCAKLRHFFFLRLLLVDTHTRKKDYLSRLFEKLVMPAVVCVDCAPQKQNVWIAVFFLLPLVGIQTTTSKKEGRRKIEGSSIWRLNSLFRLLLTTSLSFSV